MKSVLPHDEKLSHSTSKNILLLGESLSHRSSLYRDLRRSNYQTHLVMDEELLDPYVDFYKPKSILLDYRSRGDIDACSRISIKYPVPLIVLGEHQDDCAAAFLNAGADDYITEPISAVELAARIGAAIRARKNTHYLRPSQNMESFIYSDIEIDIEDMEIRGEAHSQRLSAVELGLMELLILQYPNTLCRARATRILFRREWVPGDRSVDVTLSRLKSKLRRVSRNLDIMTVRGIGYLLSDQSINTVIASDAHNLKYRPPSLSKAVEQAAHIVGSSKAEQLVEDLPRQIAQMHFD